jgi:hypothetical protein
MIVDFLQTEIASSYTFEDCFIRDNAGGQFPVFSDAQSTLMLGDTTADPSSNWSPSFAGKAIVASIQALHSIAGAKPLGYFYNAAGSNHVFGSFERQGQDSPLTGGTQFIQDSTATACGAQITAGNAGLVTMKDCTFYMGCPAVATVLVPCTPWSRCHYQPDGTFDSSGGPFPADSLCAYNEQINLRGHPLQPSDVQVLIEDSSLISVGAPGAPLAGGHCSIPNAAFPDRACGGPGVIDVTSGAILTVRRTVFTNAAYTRPNPAITISGTWMDGTSATVTFEECSVVGFGAYGDRCNPDQGTAIAVYYSDTPSMPHVIIVRTTFRDNHAMGSAGQCGDTAVYCRLSADGHAAQPNGDSVSFSC